MKCVSIQLAYCSHTLWGCQLFQRGESSRIITSPVPVIFSITSLLLRNNPHNSPIRLCRQTSHPGSWAKLIIRKTMSSSGRQCSGDNLSPASWDSRLPGFRKLFVPFAKISSDVLEVSHQFNLFLKLDITLKPSKLLTVCLIMLAYKHSFFFFFVIKSFPYWVLTVFMHRKFFCIQRRDSVTWELRVFLKFD